MKPSPFEAEPARLDRRKLLQGLLASAVFPVSKSIDLIDPTLLGYKGFQYDDQAFYHAPFIPFQIEKIQVRSPPVCG